MWNINLSVAKKYTDNLREEAMKGWAEKLAQGWLPGVPPPGYVTITENGKRIHVPNADNADLMLHVFKKYTEPGETNASIAREMDRIGIRTRKGRPYTKSKVQKILTNPFYIGINRFNGKDYPGAQQPIISKALFEKVQLKMHKGRPGTFLKHNAALKGMIRCEDCGTLVTWQLQKGFYYGACRRDHEGCKKSKLLREDEIEAMLVGLLEQLVCPAPEVIDWVADAMRNRHKDSIESREHLVASIQTQIDRVKRMEDTLYDDKLSGEITKGKYEEKHEQFMNEKAALNERLAQIDRPLKQRLEQRLVILELSQKAAELYPNKTPEQKRLILSKLFTSLTLKNGYLSVKYTKFAQAIAENVQETFKLMEVSK